ncbi:MAG: DPP IV N-terminal domain-containing protein [Bacteroidota bacterium]
MPRFCLLLLFFFSFCLVSANAQSFVVTESDYERAERALGQFTSSLVFNDYISVTWLENDALWFRDERETGYEFVKAMPGNGEKQLLFDHGQLANAIGSLLDTTFAANALPFSRFVLDESANSLGFVMRGKGGIVCNLQAYACERGEVEMPPRFFSAATSPDGKWEAYIDTHELWTLNKLTDEKKQLTFDGTDEYGYATNNAGWVKRDSPVLLWSPDSKKIATFQHDGRGVGNMHLVTTNVGRPELSSWKYPLPGDSVIFRISRVILDVESGETVRLKMPADQHRSTTTDHIAGRGGTFLDVRWREDGSQIAFISSSRDHKIATLRVADAATGEVTEILEEVTETYYESGVRKENWEVLFDTDEVIWFSERDNWGHLYLYDLKTGELKNRITQGAWAVQQVRRIDQDARKIYFTAGGREPGSPYYQHFYSINFDGSGLMHLTPEAANHDVSLSPSGNFFVDRYSTPSTAPVTVVRDLTGKVKVELARADLTSLMASEWTPPESIKVKGRDGETDIYGLMYKPSNFDPNKSYPVLNYLYPGPQSGSVGSRSFRASRSDKQAVAELGFIVVEVDAMGTPGRSKSFHDAYYGNMGDNGIPDQIAAIKELASRHSWMNLDKVGIWGHSGGGFASTRAILQYPDFYKVAVSGAGNHDNRNYEDDWGEKWQGLLEENEDGSTNYDNQSNHLLAENLKGKLLLAHGTMDTNVPHSNTMLMVDALIKANKDFDLLMIPNAGHGFGRARTYWMRKRWDYFVKHLHGIEPPKEFEFGKQKPGVNVQQPTG